MHYQSDAFDDASASEAGRHFARLRHVLGAVKRLAGRSGSEAGLLNDAASVSSAYDHAPPVVQRRFDTLVAEASNMASAGMDALASARHPMKPAAAPAAVLADELEDSIRDLRKLLGL